MDNDLKDKRLAQLASDVGRLVQIMQNKLALLQRSLDEIRGLSVAMKTLAGEARIRQGALRPAQSKVQSGGVENAVHPIN